MSDRQINDKVKRVICDHLGVEFSQVTDSANFSNDLDADSLDALDLLMGINEEFGIQIPPEKLTEIHTVQDMLKVVKSALGID